MPVGLGPGTRDQESKQRKMPPGRHTAEPESRPGGGQPRGDRACGFGKDDMASFSALLSGSPTNDPDKHPGLWVLLSFPPLFKSH